MSEVVAASLLTVGKVIGLSGVGVVVARNLNFATHSIPGISFVTTKIFLPCFLCSHLTSELSFSVLFDKAYYWAVLLSLVPMLSGFCMSYFLFQHVFLPDKKKAEYAGLLVLACTFQNAVSFGLGILWNLEGVGWLSADGAREEAQTVLFLYNICCSLLLWSGGTWIVKIEKEKELRLVAERDGRPSPQSAPVSIVRFVKETLTNITVLASLVGILIALCPPAKYVFADSYVGGILMGALSTLGSGTVPFTLLMLGTNLMPPKSSNAPSTPTKWTVPTSLVVAVTVCRLVIVPLVTFAIFTLLEYFLWDLPSDSPWAMPKSKPFRLMILLLGCAPSAANSSAICAMHKFKTAEYTQAIFVQYSTCIFTTACWLSFYLWYLG